jgi:hypothetical protein
MGASRSVTHGSFHIRMYWYYSAVALRPNTPMFEKYHLAPGTALSWILGAPFVEYHGAMCLVAHNTDGGSFYICSITNSKQEWLTPP